MRVISSIELEGEIKRRIESMQPFTTQPSSKNSRAKMKARINELSDLLGWVRVNTK